MSSNILESVETILEAEKYFDKQGSIVDAVSVLEMMAFLENALQDRKVEIKTGFSKDAGYYFTINRPNAGYMVLNSTAGNWKHDNYLEQFIMRIRLCELHTKPYRWLNEQNEKNHDIKLLLINDGHKVFLEARRHFDLYGGVRADNLCKTIEDFSVSAQILSQIAQHDLVQARKRSKALDHKPAPDYTQH